MPALSSMYADDTMCMHLYVLLYELLLKQDVTHKWAGLLFWLLSHRKNNSMHAKGCGQAAALP